MNNKQVAEIFATIADMLEIKGENIHRVLAYRRAAENIAALSQDINDLWRTDRLTGVPGIGATLATKIDELLRTGQLGFYERLAEEVPLGVVEAVNGNIKSLLRRGRGYHNLRYLLLKAQRTAVTNTEFVVLRKAA